MDPCFCINLKDCRNHQLGLNYLKTSVKVLMSPASQPRKNLVVSPEDFDNLFKVSSAYAAKDVQ